MPKSSIPLGIYSTKGNEEHSHTFPPEQGILSTERGQRALLSFGSYERSLIEVHIFWLTVCLL